MSAWFARSFGRQRLPESNGPVDERRKSPGRRLDDKLNMAYQDLATELEVQRLAVEARNSELATLIDRLRELNRLGALVASTLDRDEVPRRIVHAVRSLLGSGIVRLWLLDTLGERLDLAAGAGYGEGDDPAAESIPADGTLYGRVLREKRSLRTRDVLSEPGFSDCSFAQRERLRAALMVPLLHEERALGVLAVLVHDEQQLFDEDLALLEALASYAALALENARLAEEVGQLIGLRELDKLKGEFLQSIQHELRTPLALIHGYSELIATRDVTAHQMREMGGEIYNGSRTMIRMVDELLDFSRLETGRLILQARPTDLGALLRSVGAQIVGRSERHVLRLDIPDNLPTALVDPDRLYQVLDKLLANALQYSSGGEIAIRARPEADQIRVEVEDQGIGIRPEDLPRVFEKFYRSRGTLVSSVRGAGLGLAVARYLVEAHGGVIGLRSTPGAGSTFYFTVPLAQRDAIPALTPTAERRESVRLEAAS